MSRAASPLRTTLARRAALALASLAAACGTLAAPSRGDVDLPASIAGPFGPLGPELAPQGSDSLVGADGGRAISQPSVVTLGALRSVYVTHWQGAAEAAGSTRTVGRAVEESPRSLRFGSVRDVLRAELAWETTGVGAPHAAVDERGGVALVYESGGRIGLARSADGETFTRRSEPLLSPDPAQGEGPALRSPTLARAPDGGWWLAYESDGRIFLASATSDVEGPYTRRGAVLEPRTDPLVGLDDGGAGGFEALALDEPALSIERTPAGRPLFLLFYTALGVVPSGAAAPMALSRVGLAGSYDGQRWSRAARPVYAPRSGSVRAGALDRLDERTALLWLTVVSGRTQRVGAAIGPLVPRVGAAIPR